MAFRRRRGSRGTWLPIDPTFYGEETLARTYFDTQNLLDFDTEGNGSRLLCAAIPIAFDQTQQTDADPAATMRDVTEGQEYFLDRVVGKCWAALQTDVGGETPEAAVEAIVCFGLAILPVNDNNEQPALLTDDYDPLLSQNVMAPWIWRRTWILAGGGPNIWNYPSALWQYGSVMDGAHVDAKTKRRIRKEQRLFGIWAVHKITAVATTLGLNFSYGHDFRLHGALRRARNKSTFK